MHYKNDVNRVSLGLVKITDIFSKVFFMECILLQPWQSTLRKRKAG